jgi:hypothetical protein
MKRMFLFAIALLAVPTQIAAQVGVFCRTPAGDYPAPETAALGNTCIFRDANDLAHYGRYIRLPDHDNPRSKAGGHDFGVGVFCRTPLGDCDAAQNAVEGTPCICHQYGSAVPGTNFGIGEGSLGAFRRPGLSERRAPGQYSVEPGPSPKGSPSPPTLPPAPSVVRILDTGYERLRELGSEQKGYGLYSYILIPAASSASAALLHEIFKVIPHIRSTGALPSQLNILYIPFQNGKDADFVRAQAASLNLSITYLDAFYDYQMARAILNNLCNPPAAKMEELCQSDLSRGPFIFTYAEPASKLAPVAPPYLLVDLREVHPRAFAEFVSAFQAQVKSTDVHGGERLNTLRLKILNIALTAADWTNPVHKAVADIAHAVLPEPVKQR